MKFEDLTTSELQEYLNKAYFLIEKGYASGDAMEIAKRIFESDQKKKG